MLYIFSFRSGRDYRMIAGNCEEDEIIGEKEKKAMQIETPTGGEWICTAVIPAWGERSPRVREKEEKDDDDQ